MRRRALLPQSDPHTACPAGTSANTSGKPDYTGGATEYGVNPDGSLTRFAGRHTASGPIFDPWGYTAATIAGPKGSFTIPKNSYVDVVSIPNSANNVVVKITDTGALGPGDVIDLSAAGMKQLTGKAYNSVQVNIFICR
jgi:rare lipoprotein A (peptidoglycan hydrolase)